MVYELPAAGTANEELARRAHQWWLAAAPQAGICLDGFDPVAALPQRIAWAQAAGLDIATVLSRYSSKLQHSTESQVQENVEFAARRRLYTPPELICVDEGETGRRMHRDGLERAKLILQHRYATVLVVFKVSRLLRVGYKGFAFVQEHVVEEGLRAISVSQGIDTADEKSWKALMYLHGMMDDMLLDTIGDHCRAGLRSLFLQGQTTGALTVGYRRAEVPGAPPTNRGLPRTMPAVDPKAAELIRQHYAWIRDGMPLSEGCRRWGAAGGPCDPRSTLGRMSHEAYRKMLSNPRYRGYWAFGRMRNNWSSKSDYNRQLPQPDSEVAIYQCEELRIVDDELFFAVQKRLAGLRHGPQGPRKGKAVQLWDLTTELFYCADCQTRFHTAGANAQGMRCKQEDLCPCKSIVRRKEAVRAVCEKLAELIQRDTKLIEEVVCRAQQLDAQGDEQLQGEIKTAEAKLTRLTAKIDDLTELAGHGSQEDRQSLMAKVRAAMAERAAMQHQLAQFQQARRQTVQTITPEGVCRILGDFVSLLEDAAGGQLGEDVVYRALSVFRQLVGGRIWVHVQRRAGRKSTVVRGVFRPQLLAAVQTAGGMIALGEETVGEEVEVWLRKPPRMDQMAERVYQLIDVEGRNYEAAATVLRQEGYPTANSGNVWLSRQRYYQMRNEPVPKLAWNNGRPRQSA
jgi:site-specific DNA recombinase